MVFFEQWRESGQSADWKDSEILKDIRDYNEDDCVSTLELAEWLRERQSEADIAWVAPEYREDVDADSGPRSEPERLSMCASTTDDVPRGMEFLLSKNRLNVAISRAQSLAIVVGSPSLKHAHCKTIRQMELANFFCKIVDHSSKH